MNNSLVQEIEKHRKELIFENESLRADLARERELNRWRDCKQELPPDGEPVIIVWSRVVQHLTYARFEGEWYPYHEDPDDFTAMDSTGAVTHWMPLPEPPAILAPPTDPKPNAEEEQREKQ